MDKTQVASALGEPDLREAEGITETWHYKNQAEPRDLVFTSGKLQSFGRPKVIEVKPTQINMTEMPKPAGSVKIGEACKEDKECGSKNCHFKICSGPNNCQKVEKQVCAHDEDCCGSHCNFGICRK